MTRRAVPLALALLALFGTASCGSEPPPEGFTLRLRFTSLNPSVIESVRVSFQPQGTNERFMSIEPMSYADGAIDLTVETDGTLSLTIDGAHVAALAEMQGDASYTYDLEVYSDDATPRMPPPGVRVVVSRAGESIAQGFKFLTQWPLPLGQTETVTVPCDTGALDRCVP
jgi:hypothetical protein